MKRTFVLALVALLVLAPVAGLALGGAPATRASTGAASANVTPGGQLASVVGAGHAEVDGAYESQRLAAALDAADSDRERAAVLASARDDVDARLDALEHALADLRERDGEEDGEYAARLAEIVANARTTRDVAARAATAADALPSDVRSEYGVENGTFTRLRERATTLVDADAEAYVSDVVGDDVGEEFDAEEAEEAEEDDDGGGDETSDGDGNGDADGSGTSETDASESTESDSADSTETDEATDGTETESRDGTETESSDGTETESRDGTETESSDGTETTEDTTSGGGENENSTDGDDGSASGEDGGTTTSDDGGSYRDGSDAMTERPTWTNANASLPRAVPP